jgi:hypothetical protein
LDRITGFSLNIPDNARAKRSDVKAPFAGSLCRVQFELTILRPVAQSCRSGQEHARREAVVLAGGDSSLASLARGHAEIDLMTSIIHLKYRP